MKSNKKSTLHGHKFILAAASPWFRDTFLSGIKESTENEVKIRGVDPNIFKLIFDFSYGKDIYIKDSTHSVNILKVADRLQFEDIKVYTFSCLRGQLDESNIFDIWQASDLYSCGETRISCEEFLKDCYADIFEPPGWPAASNDYALKAITVDGLKGRIDERIFYKAALARRDISVQKMINLLKTKEKKCKKKVAKALPGTSTLGNVNIHEGIKNKQIYKRRSQEYQRKRQKKK
ncbi:hypothetical protein J3Q64DRAFT_1100504 [Phycomyces blakesleeanus]|uniref:BTB domain-containing protein n=1 Tax=Phycomyces blakesleeanus TaxID=4837 RepID=A0ABR3AZ68_PHYBL